LLAEFGYLDTDGSHYWVSARVLRLAGSYMATSRLPRTLQPMLNRLAAQTQHCLARDGHELGIHALAVPLRNMQGQTGCAERGGHSGTAE
jgi:IclR family pca regulon transcriptional regulator